MEAVSKLPTMRNFDSDLDEITSPVWKVLMLGMLILSIVCYLAALALPVYQTACNLASDNWVIGMEALLMGWAAVMYGQFAWLANPLLCATGLILLIAILRPSVITHIGLVFLGMIGFGLALSFYLNQNFVWCGSVATGPATIVQHGLGLYAWFASFVVMVVVGLLALGRYLWLRRSD